MQSTIKIFGTVIALILIFSGGVDFMITTVPGVALLAVIWGLKL
jgi:hypothetical protein